jgi:hypothetical protein
MTASITITLSDDILKVLKSEKAITLSLESMKSAGRGAAAPAKRGGRGGGGKSVSGDYRAGSLPARLVKWAGGRKRPFGVQDVMKTLKVKRAHASMVLTRVMGSGHLKRLGRGAYGAA